MKLFSFRLVAATTAVLGLAGCGADTSELSAWMEETRRNTAPVRTTIAAPKTFEPFRYDNAGLTEPFSVSKLQAALDKTAQNRSKGGLGPDLNRRREVLENFPTDTVRMVGHLASGKQVFALLQVNSLIYQAKVGNFVGQNHGRIIKVSEDEVMLKELVQDAAGEWVEKDTSLRLQEAKSEKK
jgi:type IV pilus assembly protein PilP